MRLDDEQESSNFEIQAPGSSQAGFGGGGLGLLGMIVPFVFSKFGCVGVAVLGVVVLLFGGLGSVGSLVSGVGGTAATQTQVAPGPVDRYSADLASRFWDRPSVAGANSSRGRGSAIRRQSLFSTAVTDSQAAVPRKRRWGLSIAPPTRKYTSTPSSSTNCNRASTPPGDFPIGYVIAHEVGHHIQQLDGTADKVQAAQQQRKSCRGQCTSGQDGACRPTATPASGRPTTRICSSRVMSTKGYAPHRAIGDDALQSAAGQRPVPDSFTHGSSGAAPAMAAARPSDGRSCAVQHLRVTSSAIAYRSTAACLFSTAGVPSASLRYSAGICCPSMPSSRMPTRQPDFSVWPFSSRYQASS